MNIYTIILYIIIIIQIKISCFAEMPSSSSNKVDTIQSTNAFYDNNKYFKCKCNPTSYKEYYESIYSEHLKTCDDKISNIEFSSNFYKNIVEVLYYFICIVAGFITILSIYGYYRITVSEKKIKILDRTYKILELKYNKLIKNINDINNNIKNIQNLIKKENYEINLNHKTIKSEHESIKKQTNDSFSSILWAKLAYAKSLLDMTDNTIRRRGMEILAPISHTLTIPFLIYYLDDKNDEVVWICLEFGIKKFLKMRSLDKNVVVPKLIELLGRQNPKIQRSAKEILEELDPNNLNYIAKLNELLSNATLDPQVNVLFMNNLTKKGIVINEHPPS